MKKLFIMVAILLLVTTVLGCSSTSTPTTVTATQTATTTATVTSTAKTTDPNAPKYGGTITLIYTQSPSTPIGWPANITGVAEDRVRIFFEGVVTELRDGSFIPALATSWEHDAKSVTFHLRKGVKFHDGSPFNAAAVKFNWDKSIAKKARTWLSVDVLDEYTVKVNLTGWTNETLGQFTDGPAWIASKDAYEKNGEDWSNYHPMGTAAFKFVSYERDVDMKAAKWENYWETGKPYMDAIHLRFIPDDNTRMQTMKTSKSAAMTCERGTKSAYDLLQIPGIKLELQKQSVQCLIFDTKDPSSPLSDLKVRQAIDYAINRADIAQTGYGMLETVNSIIPGDNKAFDPTFTGRPFDPAMAKKLLTEAGFGNGFELNIWANTWQVNKASHALMRDMLSAVGIKALFQYPDSGKITQLFTTGWEGALCSGIPCRSNFNRTMRGSFTGTTYVDVAWNDEFKAALEASFAAPEPDPKLIRYAVNDLITTKNAWVLPLHGAGLSWGVHSVVNGAMFLQLGYPTHLNPKDGWIAQ